MIAGTFRIDQSGETTSEIIAECSPFLVEDGRGRRYSNDGSWFGVNGAALCGTQLTPFVYALKGFLGIELQATRFPVQGINGCVIQVTGLYGSAISATNQRPDIGTYVVSATAYSTDGRTVLLAVKESGGGAPSELLDYRLDGVCAG